MAYIKQLTDLDGSTYDLRSKITNGILYGAVDSTSTSTKFTAQIPGVTEYYDGLTILLRNAVVTSAANFTIDINGLGGKPSYNNMATGNPITPTNPTRDTTIFNINYTMLIVYSSTLVSGGAWIMYRGYDANTNTIGYQLRTNSSTMPMKSIVYRYRLLFTAADGQHWVPANNSTSTNATASRTVCQDPIDPFGEIVYYGSTSAVSAGSSPAAASLWQEYTLTLGYSFNSTGAALVLPYPKAIYIKAAPQANGSAIIDSTTPYVTALPSSEDGKIYIYLGRTYSATSIELTMKHPVYYYKDGAIRPWTNQVAGGVTSVNGQTGDVTITVPTKVSDLTNDSGFISGITSSDVTTALGYTPYNSTNPNNYVDATGAANAAPVQSVNGQTGVVSLTIPTVPTNVSAFTNDAGYLTLADLPIYDGGVS